MTATLEPIALQDQPLMDWADYMLPTSAKVATGVKILRQHVEARESGSTSPLKLYIDGPTGVGKTAMARLIASKLPSAIVTEVDGSQVSPRLLATLEGASFCWRVLIINEAQNIREAKAELLMSALDSMGKRACVIFTTMRKGSKQSPLFGALDIDTAITTRCLQLNLTNQGVKSPENVGKVLEKARANGLDFGATERQIENLFEMERNSIRGVLAAISRGALAA